MGEQSSKWFLLYVALHFQLILIAKLNKMKKKTYAIIIAIVIISNLTSYIFGRYDVYMAKDVRPNGSESIWYPHFEDTRASLAFERQYANALMEGLHRFYSNDDNDFWFSSFMKTKEYQKIDSLNNSDWEDFYYYETPILEDWYTSYGVDYEPQEEFKDTVSSKYVKSLKLTPKI